MISSLDVGREGTFCPAQKEGDGPSVNHCGVRERFRGVRQEGVAAPWSLCSGRTCEVQAGCKEELGICPSAAVLSQQAQCYNTSWVNLGAFRGEVVEIRES